MTDLEVGDIVVAVAAEFSTCTYTPEEHPEGDDTMTGRYFTVTSVFIDGCVSATLKETGSSSWCTGCLRKVLPAEPDFAEFIKQKTPETVS